MRMPRLTVPLALAALLWMVAPEAMALGFGRASDSTVLGQPLAFAVEVRLDEGDYLVADCISATAFAGDNQLPASAVRVSIEAGSAPAVRSVRVRSSTAIDEPVATVILQITCPSRLARKFVLFVDPPTVSLAQTAGAPEATGAAPAQARVAEPAAVAVAAAAGSRASRERVKAAPRPRRPATVAAAVPREAAPGVAGNDRPVRSAPAPRVAQAPVAPAGAYLKLVPVETEAARDRGTAPAASGPSPAAADAASAIARAASAPDDEAAQRARDRERVQALEDSLAKMRAQSQETQVSLAQLQTRLREAEASRESRLLVPALAVLAAALAAAVGYLLWRRGTERRAAAQWWAPPTGTEAAAGEDAAGAQASAERDTGAGQHLPASDEPPLVETTASPMMLTQVQALARGGPETLPSAEARRASEMLVEELIDLEQQAEFFVVLGQDDAAIDLLMAHLRGSGRANPLAYLKLLEIHRRRDDRDAYERIRERFNRHFNSYAQDWQSDLQQGRSLLDYPKVLARLVSLWATPEQTMQALEASLLRRDPDSATFDLPAYRELLFLYAVARDLAEHSARSASVDVLLPLGGDVGTPTSARPVTASRPADEPMAAVDVDIGRLDPGPDSRTSQFDTGFGSTSSFMNLPGRPDKKPGA